MSKHPKEKENRLWKALEAAVEAVLINFANKRNWIWFKTYILTSVIWYEIAKFASDVIASSSPEPVLEDLKEHTYELSRDLSTLPTGLQRQ